MFPKQLFINPDECIDCGACEPECPWHFAAFVALRASFKLSFYLPPQLRHPCWLHPILRQHEQLTLLGPDMAFEQDTKTVHLVVRAGLDRGGLRPQFLMVAEQHLDQRPFQPQHFAKLGE